MSDVVCQPLVEGDECSEYVPPEITPAPITPSDPSLDFKVKVVDALPTVGKSNTLYLVPREGSADDVHDEYLWVENNWEKIGDTAVEPVEVEQTTGQSTEAVMSQKAVSDALADKCSIAQLNAAVGTIDAALQSLNTGTGV